MRQFIAVLFLLPGHFLILIAGLVYTNSLSWHLDMLEEDLAIMKVSKQVKS